LVGPGADGRAITLGFEGPDRVELDGNGDLLLHTAAGEIRQKKPFIYQEVNGIRHTIAGRYALGESKGEKEEGISEELITRHPSLITFEVGEYDPAKPLII